MSSVRLLSPGINLIGVMTELIAEGSSHRGVNDFSGTIVVFPGKRPAHVLRKLISARVGSAYIPPRIFSIDLFVDFLHSLIFGSSLPPVSEFDAVAILFNLHKGMQDEQKIGKEHFASLETFYPVGVKIFSELEELTIASVTPKRLRESVSSVTLTSAHSLSLLYEPFYSELKKRGYSSRAMQYQSVAEGIGKADLSSYADIILAGFFAFTQTEEKIVRHLLAQRNVTFLFQEGEGIRGTLDHLQLTPPREGEEREQEIHFYESPDAHGQLFALNRVLTESCGEPAAGSSEAVIVLPSAENLFPLYHQTLSGYDQNTYNLALGYPLSHTPVYGFLLSLLEVIVSSKEGKVFVPKYVQFLLHPYTKNILLKNRTDITRIVVHTIEDHCLENSARVFVDLDEVEQDPHVHREIMERLANEEIDVPPDEVRAHLVQIHTVTIRSFLNVRTVAGFAEACLAVLQFINEHSTAHRHPYFRPFVETMLDQFILLKESLLAEHSFGKLEHYLLFLRHFIESSEVPFTGTPLQGLQVLGFLETRGLQFDSLFMIDVNDDVLPGRAQQDVLLPLQVREQLGLSTYRDQERIKAYIFDLLRRGAKQVHYFYINNSEKEQSRFIARLQWDLQRRQRSLRQFQTKSLEYAIDLGNSAPRSIRKDAPTAALLKELTYSSTALDTYGTCGLQFYYRFVLRLKEKDEISGDVEQTDVGKIVHAILQEYFAPAVGKPLTDGDLDPLRLTKVIHDHFRTAYGSTQYGEQYFTRRQVEKHLSDYMEKVQRPLVRTSQVIVEGLEEKFAAEIGGVRFTGNADRIETRNGKTYIIDFKTGHSEGKYLIQFDRLKRDDRSTWKNAVGSLQLPMYMMLYSELNHVPAEEIVPLFTFIGKKDLDEETEVSLFESEEQMREWYPALREMILEVVREIMDEKIPFAPTEDVKNDCPSCPYRFMCGTQWVEKFSF